MPSAPQRRRILAVPEEHKGALAFLATLSDEQVERIARILQDSQGAPSLPGVTAKVAAETGLSPRRAAELIGVLGSLFISQPALGITSPQELAKEVARGAVAAEVDGFDESGQLAQALERHIARLLSVPVQGTLEPLAKGTELLFAYPTLLQDSRVYTDIRPVFSEGASPQPVGSVITHTIELETTEGATDRSHTLYISMDIRDLRKLKNVIDRALAKDASLRQSLKGTPLNALGLE